MKTYSYRRSLDFYKPYVVARPGVRELLVKRPMDMDLDDNYAYDPWKMEAGPFVQLAYRVHDLTCGPFGMLMARWVGYDCGLMPGFFFGFGVEASTMSAAMRAGIEVPDTYQGLVPYSVGIAIPLPDRRSWEIISIGSINQVAPGAGPAGLRRLTLAYGSALMNSPEIWFATRWRSHLIGIFAGLGPLKIVTAWTPAHDYPETVTFTVEPSEAAHERLLQGGGFDPSIVSSYIDADDVEAMQDLQHDIQKGLEAYIVGPGEDRGTDVRFPLMLKGQAQKFTGLQSFAQDKGVDHA